MSGFIASNGQDLYQIFYPLVPGATQVLADTKFLSGSTDLRYIFRSVIDGAPAPFYTGFEIGTGADLKDVFAVLGSITTPTPTGTVTPTPTFTPTYTPTVTPNPAPDFGFDVIYSVAAVKCDANNGLTVNLTAQASTSLQIIVGFGDASQAFPTLVSGDMVQDFIIGSRIVNLGTHHWQDNGLVNLDGGQGTDGGQYLDNYGQIDQTNAANYGTVFVYLYSVYDNPDSTFATATYWEEYVWVEDTAAVNNNIYNVTVGPGDHSITIDSRTFDVRLVDIWINKTSGPQLIAASVKTLINPGNGTQLSVSGIPLSSNYHYHTRNASENTENLDSGVLSATGSTDTVPWTGPQVNPFSIAYLEIKGGYVPFNLPNYAPTTQDPVDTNGMYASSAAWQEHYNVQNYDPAHITFLNDSNSFSKFNWNKPGLNISDEIGTAKGYIAGCYLDLAANPVGSGGSAPHTELVHWIGFTMNRDQAPAYSYSAYVGNSEFSQPGIKADSWGHYACFFRDRNNPTYGWFIPSRAGGGGYPFPETNWSVNGAAESVTLYRIESPPTSIYYFESGFFITGQYSPLFNRNNPVDRFYGRLPTDFGSGGEVGGRIKTSTYRNAKVFLSQIH